MNIKEIQDKLARFAADRDWDQFHSPKNLVMALTSEVGELNELFQWLTEDQSKNVDIIWFPKLAFSKFNKILLRIRSYIKNKKISFLFKENIKNISADHIPTPFRSISFPITSSSLSSDNLEKSNSFDSILFRISLM